MLSNLISYEAEKRLFGNEDEFSPKKKEELSVSRVI